MADLYKIVYVSSGEFSLSEKAILRLKEIGRISSLDGFQPASLKRHDAYLVQVIEELGLGSSPNGVELKIVEITSPLYQIGFRYGREVILIPGDEGWLKVP